MKEFIEKLIGRLEELKSNEGFGGTIQKMYADAKIDDAIEIVNELAEEYKTDTTFQYVLLQTDIMKRMGIDVSCKWETATQQVSALNEAYMRGRQYERDIFTEWKDEHKDKAMINEQYCWQTCSATEHCKECNRLYNGIIDYYENYDVLAEGYKMMFASGSNTKEK